MASFRFQGQRIAYRSFGNGPRVCVLVHGLLLSQRMHEPLARELATRGHRVITVDMLGHGQSDRPRDMWRYSMGHFGEQVVALLDHLELDEAIVGGTSLGANTALEAYSRAPERVRGLVLEMPVLDNALPAAAMTFTPLLFGLTFGAPIMRVSRRAFNAIPRRIVPFGLDLALDALAQDPGPSAAVVQGLFFGRVAPHRDERRTFQAPALVIGHRRDPIHPFSDSGQLVDELPNARLLEADSILEMRLSPERLTGEIADFLDECWRPRRRKPAARRRVAGVPG